MEDQRRKANALSSMSPKVGIKIQQDLIYVLRMQNQIVDTLATMASMMKGLKEDEAWPRVLEQKEEPAYCMTIEEDEEKNGKGEWYSDILQYLKEGTYPKSTDKNDQLTIRRLSTNYIICGERLYRRHMMEFISFV